MDSFIGWIGGKKLLRKTIVSMFPQEHGRYIEVFGGAGWVLFDKPPSKFEVFNDINGDLINLYKCIKYHSDELQRELQFLSLSREQFFDAKSQLLASGLTDIQRAARYYLLIRTSFGSDRQSFKTSPVTLSTAIGRLPDIQERLKRVVIEHKDFSDLIKVYDRPDALFYADPPYIGTESHYDDCFTDADHIRLRDTLTNIKGKFILSYNDCAKVRELYKDYNITAVSRNHNLSQKQREYKEVIITNFLK